MDVECSLVEITKKSSSTIGIWNLFSAIFEKIVNICLIVNGMQVQALSKSIYPNLVSRLQKFTEYEICLDLLLHKVTKIQTINEEQSQKKASNGAVDDQQKKFLLMIKWCMYSEEKEKRKTVKRGT